MRAHVVDRPGPPAVLRLRELPDPEPRPGWVHIAVRAFGLNRSELYTRQGHSGDAVSFPRVLGIECVGTVIAAPGGDLAPGTTVAAAMGGMGRGYDGGYAEQTLVPRSNVFPLETALPWDALGALPESYLTAHGVIHEALGLRGGEHVLVRGAASSVGMGALQLLRRLGCRTVATTRTPAKGARLLEAGADEVVLDDGHVAARIQGADAAIELVGSAASLPDSAAALRPGGAIGHVGYLGDDWSWTPPEAIDGRRFVSYSTHGLGTEQHTPVLQGIADGVAAGDLRPNVDTVYPFEDVVAAHERMEANGVSGKLVVLVA